MPNKIHIGMIGTGSLGRAHMTRILKMENVIISAISDPDANSVNQALQLLATKIPAYADYREMLEMVSLDAVVITTPHVYHYEQIVNSLDKGLHVLVEKPMTCSTAEALAVVEKQKSTGKVVMVGYQRHFMHSYRWVKEVIGKGLIGKISFVNAFQGQNWLANQQGKWRLDPMISGGGQLNDSGSHLIDTLIWLSELEAVESWASIDACQTDVDVNTGVKIRFSNGAIGTIAIVGNLVARGVWEDIIIAGDKGVIWIRNDGSIYLSNSGQANPVLVTDFSTVVDPALPTAASIGEAHHAKIANFFNCIKGTALNQSPAACGLETIKLTEMIWQSATQDRNQDIV